MLTGLIGTALYFQDVGRSNDFDDKTANIITGGNGEIGESSNLATPPVAASSYEFGCCSNLFGGGTWFFYGHFKTCRQVIWSDASGGTGKSSGSDLNIYKGGVRTADIFELLFKMPIHGILFILQMEVKQLMAEAVQEL